MTTFTRVGAVKRTVCPTPDCGKELRLRSVSGPRTGEPVAYQFACPVCGWQGPTVPTLRIVIETVEWKEAEDA